MCVGGGGGKIQNLCLVPREGEKGGKEVGRGKKVLEGVKRG